METFAKTCTFKMWKNFDDMYQCGYLIVYTVTTDLFRLDHHEHNNLEDIHNKIDTCHKKRSHRN